MAAKSSCSQLFPALGVCLPRFVSNSVLFCFYSASLHINWAVPCPLSVSPIPDACVTSFCFPTLVFLPFSHVKEQVQLNHSSWNMNQVSKAGVAVRVEWCSLLSGSPIAPGFSHSSGFIHGKSHTSGLIHGKSARQYFPAHLLAKTLICVLCCQPCAGLWVENEHAQAGWIDTKMWSQAIRVGYQLK